MHRGNNNKEGKEIVLNGNASVLCSLLFLVFPVKECNARAIK